MLIICRKQVIKLQEQIINVKLHSIRFYRIIQHFKRSLEEKKYIILFDIILVSPNFN